MIIGIIGGGAAGMAAALAASEYENTQVVLMERQARLGRKLSATGNGRCNRFHEYAISQFDPEQTLNWFRSLGLFTVTEESGRVYPYSDQANSVVDVLRFALEKDNIEILTDFEVTKVKKNLKLLQNPYLM